MGRLLVSFSYIFHPLFIPFAGAVAYFLVTPLQQGNDFRSTSLLPIFILTIVVPIIFFLILKSLKLISSIFAPTRRERIYPFLLGVIVHLILLYQVFPKYQLTELYFFFLGLTLSMCSALLLIFAKVKASIHMMGMVSFLVFLIGLSIHFETNLTIALSIFTFLTGVVATSRLYMRAHTKPELFIGFLIGGLSQLLLFQFWL